MRSRFSVNHSPFMTTKLTGYFQSEFRCWSGRSDLVTFWDDQPPGGDASGANKTSKTIIVALPTGQVGSGHDKPDQ